MIHLLSAASRSMAVLISLFTHLSHYQEIYQSNYNYDQIMITSNWWSCWQIPYMISELVARADPHPAEWQLLDRFTSVQQILGMGGWNDLQSGQHVGCLDTTMVHSKLTGWTTSNNDIVTYIILQYSWRLYYSNLNSFGTNMDIAKSWR